MASLTNHSPRVRLERVGAYHATWWPDSGDLGAELTGLVPVLDGIRGPVSRLLLGAAGWTVRPNRVVAAGRVVTVGYLAGQSPSIMTVRCTDGGTFSLLVAVAGQPGG